jgi:hypothetical protein
LHIISTTQKKVKLSILISLFLFSCFINAQEISQEKLDSLYIKFLQLRAPELLPQIDQLEELTPEDRKCGFQIVNLVNANIEFFKSEQQTMLKPLLQRPVLDKSIVSPSGFFRIHYDTAGINLPSYVLSLSIEENVGEVAKALDSTFSFEVDFLDYLLPPSDNGAGGDDKYDVYIEHQTGGIYGFTQWEDKIGVNSWISFMVVDNDYSGYFSSGINGLEVTVAHEFHHGIQLGNYSIPDENSPVRSSDIFFYEITSTSMEEFVYDDVNDYYQYMGSYFGRPDKAFPLQNGYNLAIWNLFLEKRFGFEIIKQQWELIPNQFAITAINNSILIYGSTFPSELNEFGIWTYFTNFKTVPGLFFEESANYPLITSTSTIQFNPPSQIANMNAAPVANNFVQFIYSARIDTLFAIVTNGDAGAAASDANQFFPFQYTLFSDSSSGNRKLTEEYSSNFGANNLSRWSVSEILNDVIVRRDSIIKPAAGSIKYAYPAPFYYSKNYITGSNIFFPVNAQVGESVDFNVYSSSMKLIYNSEKNIKILPGDQRGVSWNGLANDSKKLASGVYIYAIKMGDDVETGKVVIFNE